jgi:hypothetical protein
MDSTIIKTTWFKSTVIYIIAAALNILYTLLQQHQAITFQTFLYPLVLASIPYVLAGLGKRGDTSNKSVLGGLLPADFIKSLKIFVISTLANLILQVIQNNDVFSYQTIIYPFLLALLPYLIKQLGTNNNGELLIKDK